MAGRHLVHGSSRRALSQTAVFGTIATLGGVEPVAWLTHVFERLVSGHTKALQLAWLLPWAWQGERFAAAVGT